MSRDVDDRRRHPLREPMVLLMLALPLAAVVAGIATLVIAIRSGGADAIPESVRRTAQVQTAELGPDLAARALRLSAVLRIAPGLVEVLPVGDGFDRGRALRLDLAHPGDAARDRHLLLRPGPQGWRAAAELGDGHDWILRLAPDDGRWRLVGRLPAGRLATRLAPAIGDE